MIDGRYMQSTCQHLERLGAEVLMCKQGYNHGHPLSFVQGRCHQQHQDKLRIRHITIPTIGDEIGDITSSNVLFLTVPVLPNRIDCVTTQNRYNLSAHFLATFLTTK